MTTPEPTPQQKHFGLRWVAMLLVLPLLLWAVGCDSDSNGDDPDPRPPDTEVAAYDTITFNGNQAIVVREQTDGSGDPEGIGYIAGGAFQSEVTWTSDFEYLLESRVFVNEGQTLNIEPGTVIRGLAQTITAEEGGEAGTGSNRGPSLTDEQASALLVARGGTINASGESNNPIIFTAENDDLSTTDDLVDASGLWGGVLILGAAPINAQGGEANVEGIPSEDEPRGIYGGNSADDNSGTFEYVSIRYGGIAIGAGNEINGLTMAGVGNGTTIQFVEVYSNSDDGFEWFGGTVGTNNLVSALNQDDSFDIDQGWTAVNQFWFAVQDDASPGFGGEHDGAGTPEDAEPFATPVICNATYIGSGVDGGGDPNFLLRDNFGGSYYNSVFLEFPELLNDEDEVAAPGGVLIEDLESGEDSRARFEEGTLVFGDNLFYNLGGVDELADVATYITEGETQVEDADAQNALDAEFADAGNQLLTESPVTSVSRGPDGGLNPLPSTVAASGAPATPDGCENVSYYGAFGTDNWASGWTFLSEAGFFGTP